MSFFKNLLNFKKSKTKGGHRLGDYSDTNIGSEKGSSSAALSAEDLEAEFETLLTTSYEFDVVFTEKLLGCKLGKGSDQLTYVVSCEPASPADLNDVKRGDKIIAIDGNAVGTYHDVLSVFAAIGRPVTITFYRNESENMKKILTIGSNGSNTNANNNSSTNTSSSSSSSNIKPTITESVSAEQAKQQRRELMAKAAQDRTAAWDKRVAAASGKRMTAGDSNRTTDAVTGRPLYDHSVAATVGSLNPETQRNVQAAKRAEQKQVQAMGYNPFQPHMSFAANASATTAVGASSSGSTSGTVLGASANNNASINDKGDQKYYGDGNNNDDNIDIDDVDEADVIDAVDDAFALLMSGTVSLSHNESSSSAETALAMQAMEVQINTALLTVMKMLSSLYKNKKEVKFRSIRLMNENFQTKVANVPGGLDLMLAAGFVLEVVTGSGEAAQEVFLRHDMSLTNERKLDYTFQRLTELQESA